MQPLPSPATETESLPRQSLGGYELLRKIGSGGMASVYLGQRTTPEGQKEFAAIKVILPGLMEDEEFVDMFRDEARLTASVRHPYVCSAIDYGEDDGLSYLATEYVLGETWRDLVRAMHATPAGAMTARRILPFVVAQVCEALHAVHETRNEQSEHLAIVHRDVSPRNVMICYDGTVRLLDFGIAHAARRRTATRQGILKGQAPYAAPEQVHCKQVDRRTDLWPVGVMLWEGVTGRRLFHRNDKNATMQAVCTEPLGPLLEAVEAYNAPLRPVLERALARDPNNRFATAAEMADALRKCCPVDPQEACEEVASWMSFAFSDRLEEKHREVSLSTEHSTSWDSHSRVRPSRAVAQPSERRPLRDRAHSKWMKVQPHALALYDRLRQAPKPWLWAGGAAACLLTGWLLVLAVRHLTSPPEFGAGAEAEQTVSAVVTAPPAVVEVRSDVDQLTIELEGRALGEPPFVAELPPGRHTFDIRAPGKAPTRKTVEVEAEGRYLLRVE